jgi:hypothetical protein
LTPPNDNPIFNQFYKVRELADRDPFFSARKFDKNESSIQKFFLKMLKRYQELLNTKCPSDLKIPLIFVIEDSHLIDEVKDSST